MNARNAALLVLGAGAVALLLPGFGGGVLGIAAIANYARNAGFTGQDLLTAVAIALAESSGDPNAQGDWTVNGKIVPKGTPGAIATSYGLWQIHWTVHPEFDKNSLFDPQANANAAFQLFSNRGSFGDWSTFNSDAYLAHLGDVEQNVSV